MSVYALVGIYCNGERSVWRLEKYVAPLRCFPSRDPLAPQTTHLSWGDESTASLALAHLCCLHVLRSHLRASEIAALFRAEVIVKLRSDGWVLDMENIRNGVYEATRQYDEANSLRQTIDVFDLRSLEILL